MIDDKGKMQEVRVRWWCGVEGGNVGQGETAEGTDTLEKGWVQEEAKAASKAGAGMHACEKQ